MSKPLPLGIREYLADRALWAADPDFARSIGITRPPGPPNWEGGAGFPFVLEPALRFKPLPREGK